ncbi:MAG TPA: hypothetical protein PKD27_14125 [Tepidiformaceae bacterium]|nr:hypothetical protein [Tepidiformaceae bacterium]
MSALVAGFLASLGERDAEFVRLEALQERVQGEIRQFSAADRLTRDLAHDRALR